MYVRHMATGSLFFWLIISLSTTVFNGCSGKSDDGKGPEDSSWRLVWSDEFEEDGIDTNKWNFETGGHGWGNNELQFYTNRTENAYTDSGYLFIKAQREYYEERNFTSARLTTKNKGDWKYGKMEIKARLPEGQGIWPAIWMLPTESVYGGWPASGEIDIMELVGHEPSKVHGTIHYGGNYPEHVYQGDDFTLKDGEKFSEKFHLFSVEWEPGEIRWYVDGMHFYTQSEWYSRNQLYPAPFDQRFFIILNIAVGGNWPGSPDASTQFPQIMAVDYVRVYTHTGQPPTITLSLENETDQHPVGEKIRFVIRTDDPDSSVEYIEMMANGKRIGELTEPDDAWEWYPTEKGEYAIIAKVKNAVGRTGLSDTIYLTIGD